ncbi:MAG: YdcF family protein [Polyangiales bacterium]
MLSLSRFLDVALLLLTAWGATLAALRWRAPFTDRRVRYAWRAAVGVWAVGWLAATPAVGLSLVRSLEPPPADLARLDVPSLRDRTALVVLSSSVLPAHPGDTPAERLDSAGTARVIGAARVWRRLQTRAVIVTGRAPGDDVDANTAAMEDLLVTLGVPRERIVREPWALNTRQNAIHSVRIARRMGLSRYVVVTSALHMPRSLREFRRAGVDPIAAPVHPLGGRYGGVTEWIPVSWGWSATSAALHEYLGMLKP